MSLSTNYLGLVLKNPLVASSSPLSHTVPTTAASDCVKSHCSGPFATYRSQNFPRKLSGLALALTTHSRSCASYQSIERMKSCY